jgi:hypothetical protein
VTTHFSISTTTAMRWIGLGGRDAIEFDDTSFRVRFGTFRVRVPLGSVAETEPIDTRIISAGVHGWRGRWLVNGSSRGLLRLTIDPGERGRLLGVPIRVRELTLSLDDRDGFLGALGPRPQRSSPRI